MLGGLRTLGGASWAFWNFLELQLVFVEHYDMDLGNSLVRRMPSKQDNRNSQRQGDVQDGTSAAVGGTVNLKGNT